MCVDYRALNKLTVKNGYPLPRIQELVDTIGQSMVLSKIDLTSGYWQVRMGEMSIPKTAFNTVFGKFEFLAMPFGLSNAPATFQTMMNARLQPYLMKFCVVYLDDILIFSRTREEHYEHITKILEVLEREELYAKPNKCIFAQEQLEFCGHIVGRGTVVPVPQKVKVVEDWPQPRNVHEVRQFLGLATYYRRYVRDFARIAAPLHELLKETDEELKKKRFRPIKWTPACNVAFKDLKRALTANPVLTQPDPTKPYIIETDASEWAVGYVLLQVGEDGKLHPIAFDGRKLNQAELNYPTHEKELLAIKEALRTWERYIDNGHTVTIVTDHETLQYLGTTTVYSKRLARWISEFQQYDLKIKYRKGSEAIVPDAISRRPDFVGKGPANKAQDDSVRRWLSTFQGELSALLGLSEQDWLAATIQYLKDGTVPESEKMQRAVEKHARDLRLEKTRIGTGRGEQTEETLVYIRDGTSVPYLEVPFRRPLVERMHEEFGHLGHPGLLGVVGARAWWPSLKDDIQAQVHLCKNCQVSQGAKKHLEREQAQRLTSKGIRPFERWGIDCIGRLPATPNGNRWIITAIDYATGWPVARAVPDATAEEIAKFIHEEIYLNCGAPVELVSDNGPNLLAPAVALYMNILKTKHRTTTPYHPRTNGKCENLNGTLGRMLTKYLMGKPTRLWDEYLPQTLFATRVHEHTTMGRSPFYMLYGVEPRIPSDPNEPLGTDKIEDWQERIQRVTHARSKANELLLNRAIRTQKIHDLAVTKTSFTKGDWVLVRNESPTKFQSKWFGPYKVLSAHPLGTYRLEEPNGRILRNLINGARMVEANVDDPEELWSSGALARALKRKGLELTPAIEVQKIVDGVEPLPVSYDELSSLTRKEWLAEMKQRGISLQEGEEPDAVDALQKIHAKSKSKKKKEQTSQTFVSKAPRRRGRPARKRKDAEDRVVEDAPPETSASVFEESDGSSSEGEYRAEVEDVPLTTRCTRGDARKSRVSEKPFAVVITSNKNGG